MARILFFAPHSAIWVHAYPEALVAEALQQQGNQVVYITCGEEFKEYCVAMSSYRLLQESPQSDKQLICNTCRANKRAIRQSFALDGYDLRDALTPADREQVDRIMRDARQ